MFKLRKIVFILLTVSLLLSLLFSLCSTVLSAEQKAVKEFQFVFKSPQAEAAYMAAYDRALANWPVPYETIYVPTEYGDTFMIVSGPEDGEPIILIHGMGSNAADWKVNFAALASTYRVYALDIIGYANKSKPVKVFSDRAEFAEWITSILDALKIEKTHMLGYSLGGFLTVSYAIEKPERLKKIVLLAPAATFIPFSKAYHLKVAFPFVIGGLAINAYGIRSLSSYALEGMCKIFNISKEGLAEENIDMAELMLPFQEESLKEYRKKIDSLMKSAAKSMYAPGNFVEDEYPENFLWSLLLGTEYGMPLPPKFGPYVLPDEELKKISTPTLLLIGEQEMIYDAKQVMKLAEELLENIQTALIPNANHMLNLEQTELVNSHILNFLSGDN